MEGRKKKIPPFQIILPPHDFFEIPKNLRNSEKLRKKKNPGSKKIRWYMMAK